MHVFSCCPTVYETFVFDTQTRILESGQPQSMSVGFFQRLFRHALCCPCNFLAAEAGKKVQGDNLVNYTAMQSKTSNMPEISARLVLALSCPAPHEKTTDSAEAEALGCENKLHFAISKGSIRSI